MDGEEEVWVWLKILSYLETAMLKFIHPWDMPCLTLSDSRGWFMLSEVQ